MADQDVDVVPAANRIANGGNAGQNPNQGGQQLLQMIKTVATRILIFYVVSSVLRYAFQGKQELGPGGGLPGFSSTTTGFINAFEKNEIFDMYFYLSTKAERFSDFNNDEALFWRETGLVYGDWKSGENSDGSRSKLISMPTPAVLQNNGSLYLHVFAVKSGKSPVPEDENFAGREIVHGSVMLNKFKKKHYQRTANLLTGRTNQSEVELQKADEVKYEILNYWHENITVNIVDDHTVWTLGRIPSPLDEAITLDQVSGKYNPILYFNTFWNLGADYQAVNASVPNLNLTITYAPLSLLKYQMYASQQMRGKWSQMFGSVAEDDKDDQDAIKQALLETNPLLLGVTAAVSILHTVLEFLAFRSDIQFWQTRTSLEGLSVRSVLFNVLQSLIVLLYICDNDSSFLIKMSVGLGCLVELWKIPKCLNIEVKWDDKIFGLIPKVKISDKGSYVKSATKEYDEMAYKYLSWALFPLLASYAAYSLVYEEQRGWYSWVLSMLYGFLLMFGFIMMTPQLFINYKFKSVAHLPWRMLTYKFINTFIDDLFAFVIRMPTLYRIGCFRDDIIFFVYMYQRWAYRVDPKRVNEFGVSFEEPADMPAEIEPFIGAPAAEEVDFMDIDDDDSLAGSIITVSLHEGKEGGKDVSDRDI